MMIKVMMNSYRAFHLKQQETLDITKGYQIYVQLQRNFKRVKAQQRSFNQLKILISKNPRLRKII